MDQQQSFGSELKMNHQENVHFVMIVMDTKSRYFLLLAFSVHFTHVKNFTT